MSGSNGVQKFAEVNRDDQIINLRTRGGNFTTVDRLLITGTSSITADQYIFNEIVFDGTTPSVLTLDTLNNIFAAYTKNNTLERGSSFRSTIINNDQTNTKTLTLPAGMVYFETAASTIAIPPNTRLILTNEITATLNGISVYPDSFSGMTSIISPKQAAIPCPLDTCTPIFSQSSERANWVMFATSGGSAINPNMHRNNVSNATPGAVTIIYPLIVPSVLSTNTNPNAGFTLTSVKFYYTYVSAANPVGISGTVNYLIPSQISAASGLGVGSLTVTSDQPPSKPATNTAFAIIETVTLQTPLRITQDTMVYGTLLMPNGAGIPTTNCAMSVFGCVFYGTYQYSD